MLGWDVGTFEFMSDRIVAEGYNHHAKLKMRTGGSTGKIGRTACHNDKEGSGYYWDITKHDLKKSARLPVKFRFRSPVVFEFHLSGKRKADAYAVIWLQHLVDNEPTEIDIPIWKTSSPARLTQNYITEKNYSKDMPGLEDLEEVGRLKFTGRFKAGMDESHEAFVSDNDSRETYETWEACLAEGVRQRLVEKELPERIQSLHDESLTEGRDILKQADPEEKQKWLSKQGTDWSGAFGEDPKAYMDSKGKKRREPGVEPPLHDPHNPSDDEDTDLDEDDENDDSSTATADLGVMDADNALMGGKSQPNGNDQGEAGRASVDTTNTNATSTTQHTYGSNSTYEAPGVSEKDANKQNKRTEERKQRGLMQWKPARNMKFAKDEGKLGLRKLKNKITGGMNGREPGVETEA